MIYKTCPYCGAHLDPGERCDCPGAKKEVALLQQSRPLANGTTDSLSNPRPEVKSGERAARPEAAGRGTANG